MKNSALIISGARLDKLRVMMKTKPSFCFGKDKKENLGNKYRKKFGSNHSILVT